jgi:hypothetical protein
MKKKRRSILCTRKNKMIIYFYKVQTSCHSHKPTTMVGVRQPVTHLRDGKSMCRRGTPDSVVDLVRTGRRDGVFCVGADSRRTDGKIANGI